MRSQFLTLLCILTFLSCAWGLSDAFVSFTQTDAVSESLRVGRPRQTDAQTEKTKKYFEDRSSDDVPTPSDPTQVRSLAVAQFFYSLITHVGAILMFRLRRVGFWVYVAGVSIGLLAPVLLAGFGALNTSFWVFFSLVFVIVYCNTLNEMH